MTGSYSSHYTNMHTNHVLWNNWLWKVVAIAAVLIFKSIDHIGSLARRRALKIKDGYDARPQKLNKAESQIEISTGYSRTLL